MANFPRQSTNGRSLVNVVLLIAAACMLLNGSRVWADDEENEIPSIKNKTDGMNRQDGFFPIYWDESSGKLYLEIAQPGREFLYVNALATGVGSNPLGLDRGQLGRERVVRFERVGPKVLLVQRNLDYRAMSGEASEKKAVTESFAESILWGGEIAARTDDRVLVDFTGFVLSDAANVTGRLRNSDQGSFSLNDDRSAMYMPHTRAFPDNTEMEAILTFVGNDPGRLLRETAPSPEAVTVRQRHSFIRLPDDMYGPRQMNPRCGMFFVDFADYSAPIESELKQRWVMRHRLIKKHPEAANSEAVEPIVYYVDRAIPEPIRSAVIEGAAWWAEAFEAAGFRDAFRVEVAPEDMDLLDVRNNVIQWVHRSTRGWSYGGSVHDPRTGEIIKGHVSLGSLRVRQDRLLMEGLDPQYEASAHECAVGLGPTGIELAAFDPAIAPTEIALARIRQLACHEVGHTLGFAHNFAASTYGRASVMDYPAPLARLTEAGTLDMSDAYGVGVGVWDKLTTRYAYTQFANPNEEAAGLAAIVQEAIDSNLLFVSDADSRSAGSAHPLSNLWDNGADPIAELDRLMSVRRAGLDRFSEANIGKGEPLSHLEDVLAPLYLSHRYQLDATAKSIGGLVYTYAMRGDDQVAMAPVPAERQRAALEAMLRTIQPSQLALSERVLKQIPPQAYGYYEDRERFNGKTGRVFDPLAAAQVAAEMTIGNLLQPARAARLVVAESQNNAALTLGEVLDRLIEATWIAELPGDDYQAAVARVVENVALDNLIDLAGNPNASHDVTAIASSKLAELAELIAGGADRGSEANRSHHRRALDEINRFLNRPHAPADRSTPVAPPPGSPIGDEPRR